MKQCKDFVINSENSDAKCFRNSCIKSDALVERKPELCDLCPYNKKYSKMNYDEWEKFKKENQQ